MTPVSFIVTGVAEPQGSARAFVARGRANITHDNPSLSDWRKCVAFEARRHIREVFPGAVRVSLEFALPRPKSLPKRVHQHTKKPDIDKLERGFLDALTQIAYVDDSYVVEVHKRKRYARGGEVPHVAVRIEPVEE